MTLQRNPHFDETLNETFEPLRAPILSRPLQPADLLATFDPELYQTRLDEWFEEDLRIALGRDTLPEAHFQKNRERFGWLAKLAARRRVVPFVGAGASASCGAPTWTQYLRKVAAEHAYSTSVLEEHLSEGRYEDAATALLKHVGEQVFREAFDRAFAALPPPATNTLPPLIVLTFDGPVVTTNYDQLLERDASPTFQTFLGSEPGEFLRAAREGGRALLKIHGDLYQPRRRVLTKSEYDKAYGPDEVPDLTKALPRALRWLFLRDTMLFIGASLTDDRTMRLLRVLANDRDEGLSMRHFAIVEYSDNPKAARKREKFLTDRGIFPIWYAARQYHLIPTIVQHLARIAKELR